MLKVLLSQRKNTFPQAFFCIHDTCGNLVVGTSLWRSLVFIHKPLDFQFSRTSGVVKIILGFSCAASQQGQTWFCLATTIKRRGHDSLLDRAITVAKPLMASLQVLPSRPELNNVRTKLLKGLTSLCVMPVFREP